MIGNCKWSDKDLRIFGNYIIKATSLFFDMVIKEGKIKSHNIKSSNQSPHSWTDILIEINMIKENHED